MSGPEQQLLATMANGLGVRVAGNRSFPDPKDPSVTLQPGQPWPAGDESAWRGKFGQYLDGARRGGSPNWTGMCATCELMSTSPHDFAAGQADGLAFLQEQKLIAGWMFGEEGSRVYGLMHLFYALIFVRLGGEDLKALAWESLDLAKFVLYKTLVWPSQRCLWYGERSAEAGREQPDTYDDLAAWLRGYASFPAGHTLDVLILQALRPELDALRARPLANPAWAMAEPVTIWVGDDGAAVCSGAERNHNTPKVCAGSTVGAPEGEVLLAPAAPYLNRIREQDTQGVAVADEAVGVIHYSADPRMFAATAVPLPRLSVRRYVLGSGSIDGEAVLIGPGTQAPPIASATSPAPAASRPGQAAPKAPSGVPTTGRKRGGLPPLVVAVLVVAVFLVLFWLGSR